MKGLAWYCGIMITWCVISCFISAVCGSNTAVNLWAVFMYVPVIVFFVKYLKELK